MYALSHGREGPQDHFHGASARTWAMSFSDAADLLHISLHRCNIIEEWMDICSRRCSCVTSAQYPLLSSQITLLVAGLAILAYRLYPHKWHRQTSDPSASAPAWRYRSLLPLTRCIDCCSIQPSIELLTSAVAGAQGLQAPEGQKSGVFASAINHECQLHQASVICLIVLFTGAAQCSPGQTRDAQAQEDCGPWS